MFATNPILGVCSVQGELLAVIDSSSSRADFCRERVCDDLRVVRRDGQQHPCCARRLAAVLLPSFDRAGADPERSSELAAREVR